MKWRIINEGNYSEPVHQALEEHLTEKIQNGEMQPTLRFWYRSRDSVPMGRFQAYSDEVEEEYIQENGIDVVRRITGGGAMFVEPGNVITYSLYLPKDQVSEDIQESYQELGSFAVEALNELGVDADYQPLNDIEHEEGKLGGAAQLRKKNAVLHHTTMSYDLDTKKMLKALRIGKEKVSDKAVKSAEKRVSRIKDHSDSGRSEVVEKMIEKFSEDTDEERKRARDLAEEKFSTDEWNRKL
ncbi:MAG: lipoate--protein ligase family protein [Nanohaloarchaea archaeon SW_7_46_7]|nr:MAG: lipoate--protein ligase family protein [Nanohaloarchaea archaeon SW_7_46_7]